MITLYCFDRLNADEQIQMVTALILQLIQCVVKLPKTEKEETDENVSLLNIHLCEKFFLQKICPDVFK